MATDWPKLKLEYVNGSMSLRDLAGAHGINAAGVLRRAAKEGWEAERNQKSSEVISAAQSALTNKRVNELEKFNEDDLRVSKALRAVVAQRLNDMREGKVTLSPADIRALAGTADTAQKIGRLALGANTEQHAHTGAEGGPIGVASVPVDVYLEARKAALDAY